jgi:formamidase
MPEVAFPICPDKSRYDQQLPPHNRWHPEIPAAVSMRPGSVFRMECLEWTDGQVGNNDDPTDVAHIDLSIVHVLSGPIHIQGAEPGDLLVVDILDLGPFPDRSWGYTGIFARNNGGGFLTEEFPDAAKAVWDLNGIWATSRHLPGVRFPGIAHPGLIGCAPSPELLATWNRRESALVARAPDRVPPLAKLPEAANAILGSLTPAFSSFKRVAAEAARTIPPREHGGNVDIKNLSKGSRVYFPVYVPGANLSVGDLHFSQGDGEISFCGAIEMAGWIDLHVDVIKGGMATYAVVDNPIFVTGPVEPKFSRYVVFEGISVDRDGTQLYLDAHVAYRNACLNAVRYLEGCGFTGEQAYLLLSAAPCEGRLSGIVDIPNACCTLALPTEIFDDSILPAADYVL